MLALGPGLLSRTRVEAATAATPRRQMDRFVVPRSPKRKRGDAQREEQMKGNGKGRNGGTATKGEQQKKVKPSPAPKHDSSHVNEKGKEREQDDTSPSLQVARTVPSAQSPKKGWLGGGLPPGIASQWRELDGAMEVSVLLDGGVFKRYPRFLTPEQASDLFESLQRNLNWQQSDVRVHGKVYKSPRLQCWMADSDMKASLYLKTQPTPWSDEILALKTRLEDLLGCKFNYLLFNQYRDGKDYIAFHADREAIDEGKGVIASLSLGATRRFVLKHNSGVKLEYAMTSGSLMVMDGHTQRTWKHSVPKEARVKHPRINLTFRIN